MKPTILVAAIALAVYVTSAGADAANEWNHKALNDERRASAIVGGFSKSGARFYHDGLAYVRGNNISVGSKTISDVIELGKHHGDNPHRTLVPKPTRASSNSSPASVSAWLAWMTVIGIVIFAFKKKRRSSSADSPIISRPSEYELAQTCSIDPISVPGLLLHKDEVFYLRTNGDVAVIAEHHHAEFVGRSAGVSMRVMRGVSVRTGASRGHRVDRTTLDVDDHGTLYLSNQRVLFVGGRKTVDIPFTRLVGVEPFVDGLKVNRSNAKPLVLKTGSQREAVVLQRIIANDLQPTRPIQPTTLPDPVSTDLQPHVEPGQSSEGMPKST